MPKRKKAAGKAWQSPLMATTQPAEWIDAFKEQAAAEGLTLSEWVGQCCLRRLPKEVRQGLGERPPKQRPKGD